MKGKYKYQESSKSIISFPEALHNLKTKKANYLVRASWAKTDGNGTLLLNKSEFIILVDGHLDRINSKDKDKNNSTVLTSEEVLAEDWLDLREWKTKM